MTQTLRYRETHREEASARSRAWYAANSEWAKARIRAWQRANPERVRAYRAKWRASHVEWRRNYKRGYVQLAGQTVNTNAEPPEFAEMAIRIRQARRAIRMKGTHQ